jgi:hypothetical protein
MISRSQSPTDVRYCPESSIADCTWNVRFTSPKTDIDDPLNPGNPG